jgi:hypothetical protein
MLTGLFRWPQTTTNKNRGSVRALVVMRSKKMAICRNVKQPLSDKMKGKSDALPNTILEPARKSRKNVRSDWITYEENDEIDRKVEQGRELMGKEVEEWCGRDAGGERARQMLLKHAFWDWEFGV